MARRTESDIRLSVAMALPRFVGEGPRDDDPSVAALIELTADRVDVIRDWATFGLGTQTSAMGPKARAALISRLDDVDSNTRHESLVALARRHERAAVPALLRARRRVHRIACDPGCQYLGASEASEALADLAQSADWQSAVEFARQRCSESEQHKLLRSSRSS